MKKSHLKISVVLPCRDEGRGLHKLVGALWPKVYEILVINNRSKVSPLRLVRSIKNVRVINENRVDDRGIGYGYAHQTGLNQARGDLVVAMDGDGTYPVEAIQSAVDVLLKQKLDIVFCSRFPLDTEKSISWYRQLGVWVLNTESKLLFNYLGSDILSGMWVGRKEILQSLDLREGGWNLSPEIKLAAHANRNLKVGELHINHYVRNYDKSKQVLWRTGLEHFAYILSRWAKIAEYLYEKAV